MSALPRPQETRPPSSPSSRLAQKSFGTASITEIFSGKEHSRKNASLSSRRFSSSSTARISEDAAQESPNRWSQSTTSSVTHSHHRRHSSIQKRFTLGSSAFAPVFRSSSPTKKRRSTDASSRIEQPSSPSSNSSLPPVHRFSPLNLPSLANNGPGPEQDSRIDRVSSTDTELKSPPPAKASLGPGRPDRIPPLKHRHGSGADASQTSSHAAGNSRYMSDPKPLFATNGVGEASRSSPIREKPLPHQSQTRSRDVSPTKSRHNDSQDGSQSGMSNGSTARRRNSRDKEKKVVLSKALQRAHDAVLLDKAENYMGAVAAYEEACSLLESVMSQTTVEHDREKLVTIRGTYLSRINELSGTALNDEGFDSRDPNLAPVERHNHRDQVDGSADESGIHQDLQVERAPPEELAGHAPYERGGGQQATQYSQISAGGQNGGLRVANPEAARMSAMPKPLSPRHSPRIEQMKDEDDSNGTFRAQERESGVMDMPHSLARSTDTTSWYNAAGEGVGSRSSSPNHSISSAGGVRRRNVRNEGSPHESFDAMFDEAIETAYGSAFQPSYDTYVQPGEEKVPRSVRQSDPIAEDAKTYDNQAIVKAAYNRTSVQGDSRELYEPANDNSEDESGIGTDEEDQLLSEEPDSLNSEATATPATKPRQSDSSGFSNRTWGSSAASSLNTAGTSLSTVDENASMPALPSKLPTLKPLPAQPPSGASQSSANPNKPALPPPNKVGSSLEHHDASLRSPVPLDGRFSSQKARNLKIETSTPQTRQDGGNSEAIEGRQEQRSAQSSRTDRPTPQSGSTLSPETASSSLPSSTTRLAGENMSSPNPSPFKANFPPEAFSPNPAAAIDSSAQSSSPQWGSSKSDRPLLKSHTSSASVQRSRFLAGQPEATDGAPASPMSFGFPSSAISPQERGNTFMPMTPAGTSFGSTGSVSGQKSKQFETEIHHPRALGYPNPDVANAPARLEPCPDEVNLRPFWMMRRFREILRNSKGAYITTKLFIPHDVWRMKNNKLKGVEEKVNQMDFLTSALYRFNSIDTLDAEAVLAELTVFESSIDQAQKVLYDRLGRDVGVKDLNALFNQASPTAFSAGGSSGSGGNEAGNTTSTGSRASSKSYFSSFRKLRNKTSSNNLSSNFAVNKDSAKEKVAMKSLPITEDKEPRRGGSLRRPRTGEVQIPGPNQSYAAALAKLCDAVEILDEIARQAHDEGLRKSSGTHVGLELGTRHVSEFFGCYVCRFVLQDLIMLTDKYLKRSTEWIMAN